MADSNQSTPNSRSQGKPQNAGAPIGTPRAEPDVSSAVAEAKEVGTELISAVREGATSFFEEQRNRAASEIASLGEALRESARCLDRTGSTALSRYAEDAAGEIEQFANRLRTRSLGMMANDIEDFAQRWPAAFMAAAVGAGFLAGRFLISSSARPQSQTMERPMSRSATAMPATTMNEPIGGARHNFGAVGGTVSGTGNAGYGGGNGMRERH
jgi:hypothetical protein